MAHLDGHELSLRAVMGENDPVFPEGVLDQRQGQLAIDALSRREREVLGLMAEGRSNQGIADTLFVTVSAVERHVTRIFVKLGLAREARDHRRVIAVLSYLQR